VPGYRLIARIGQGGSADVWKARGPGGFPLALKLIPLATTDAAAELAALELLREVRHPNLITVFGAWQVNGLLAVAMELADRNLWDRYQEAVAQGRPGIPRPELLEYVREAAKAIDYLNAPCHHLRGRPGVGVQHRDIKPHNLLLVGGSVKVADFGLARRVGHAATDTVHLTPAYAGPERFHGQTSGHSDQYALAVTYCQLRGGRLPFTGSVWQVMVGHSQDAPDLGMLPEAERPAIARALAKHPEDRWPDCRTLVEELARTERSPTARKEIGAPGRSGQGPGRRHHLPGWVAAASLLVLVTAPKAGLDSTLPAPEAVAQAVAADPEPEASAPPTTSAGEQASALRGEQARTLVPRQPEVPEEPAETTVTPEELARLHNARGDALVAAKDYGPAIAEFTEAIRLRPDEARAYRQRGHLHAARGDYDAALADYQRALRLSPADAEAHHGQGLAWYFTGDFDRAIGCFTAALQVTPANAPVLNSRALAYTARGDLDLAVADLSAALRSEPRYAEAFNNRGAIYARQGNLDRALADFREARRLDPSNPVYERNWDRVAARLAR
jgi:tetratricopeptide (TPR) repeat protein